MSNMMAEEERRRVRNMRFMMTEGRIDVVVVDNDGRWARRKRVKLERNDGCGSLAVSSPMMLVLLVVFRVGSVSPEDSPAD